MSDLPMRRARGRLWRFSTIKSSTRLFLTPGRTEEEEVKGYSNQAGYRLLGKVRQKDIRTPFLIYSTSNDYKYKAEIYTKFGQGSTNDPIELFSLVLSHLPSN